MEDLSAGALVMTTDRKQIGRVKEVRGSYFKVDAPMHRDFWLQASLIDNCADEMVLLSVSSESVGEHHLDQPGLEPGDDPMAAIMAEPVIGADEMLEQRARMEREMAEQSRHLSPHEPSVTQARGAHASERIPADHTGFGELAGEYVPNAPVQDRLDKDLKHQRQRQRLKRVALGGAVLAGAATLGTALLRKLRPAHVGGSGEQKKESTK